MKADIIIAAAIVAYCIFVVVRRLRVAKEGGACCGCSCGSSCGSSGQSCGCYGNLVSENKKEQ